MGSSLKIFVPHGVEALLNAHHTQHLSASCLTSYGILLLTMPYIILAIIILTLPPFFPPLQMILLMTVWHWQIFSWPLCDDLQETPLDNTGFSWFTSGSYLRDENGKYAGNALETPFEISEVAPLPLATLAQWAEFYTFAQACIFNQGQNCKYLC